MIGMNPTVQYGEKVDFALFNLLFNRERYEIAE
jgi:hypothetical protein